MLCGSEGFVGGGAGLLCANVELPGGWAGLLWGRGGVVCLWAAGVCGWGGVRGRGGRLGIVGGGVEGELVDEDVGVEFFFDGDDGDGFEGGGVEGVGEGEGLEGVEG